MEWNQCGHLGYRIYKILACFHPEVNQLLVSAQSDRRFGKRYRKLIFKMAAVDVLLAHLPTGSLCLLRALILIIKF